MKTFKFFALCSLVVALLAVPFAVLASSASSPLFGTGFDSSFIVDHAGWNPLSGTWKLAGENYYASPGVLGEWASIRHYGVYENMVYQAKMYRTGCLYCANVLSIRLSGGVSSIGSWVNGYYFEYSANGYISVWKSITGDVVVPLVDWVPSNAVKRGSNINKLKVVASGASFAYYVNDILVVYGTDSSFPIGQVGISFYKDSPFDKGKLYVDWARLTLGSGAALPKNVGAVKPWVAGSGGDPSISPAP